jgi:hypothetical protein
MQSCEAWPRFPALHFLLGWRRFDPWNIVVGRRMRTLHVAQARDDVAYSRRELLDRLHASQSALVQAGTKQ